MSPRAVGLLKKTKKKKIAGCVAVHVDLYRDFSIVCLYVCSAPLPKLLER